MYYCNILARYLYRIATPTAAASATATAAVRTALDIS